MTDPTRVEQQPLELTNEEIQLIHKFDFRAGATLTTIAWDVEMLIEGIRPEKHKSELQNYIIFLEQRIAINTASIEDLKKIPKPAFQQLAQILAAANEFFTSFIKEASPCLENPTDEKLESLHELIRDQWKQNIAPRFSTNPAYAAFKTHLKAEDLEDTRNTIQ